MDEFVTKILTIKLELNVILVRLTYLDLEPNPSRRLRCRDTFLRRFS